MRLSEDKIKRAILHPERDVRDAAVFFFAGSFSPDETVMPLVIEAVEKYGWDEAFAGYCFLDRLAYTSDTVRWLMAEIERAGQPENDQEARYPISLLSALRHADPAALGCHETWLTEMETIDDETREAIEERIWFLSRNPDELWQDLESFCHANEDEDDVPPEEFEFACRVAEGLGHHRERYAERVLSILRGDTDDFDAWMEVFAVRLAGEMKLEQAIPYLTDFLHDCDDWLSVECHRALARIGSDSVIRQLAQECRHGDWELRFSAACILEDVHSDESVQTCLDLLDGEEDQFVKCRWLQSVLRNFSPDGIEPARQFILNTALDPDVLDVRSILLTACKLMDETFPEFEAWQEDAKGDQEFRKTWYAQHPSVLDGDDWDEDDWDDDFEDGFDERVFDEDDLDEEHDFENVEPEVPPPSVTFVRAHERIGRNDPCPCGSGKKYKKCCLGKSDVAEETDWGHSASISGVRDRQSKPEYPIGTDRVGRSCIRTPSSEPVRTVIENVLPVPGVLETVMPPPSISLIRLLIVSPRPVPPNLRVVLVST